MSMTGMNIESIRTVSNQLSSQGGHVAEVARAVDSLLSVARQHWRGDDLRQFDGRWTGQYRATCLRLAEQLSDLARTAAQNADAQDKTSSTLDGGAGFGHGGLGEIIAGAVKTLFPDGGGPGGSPFFNPDGTPKFVPMPHLLLPSFGGGDSGQEPSWPLPGQLPQWPSLLPSLPDVCRVPEDDPIFKALHPHPEFLLPMMPTIDPDLARTFGPDGDGTPRSVDGIGGYKATMDLLDTVNNMELLRNVKWDQLEFADTGSSLISTLGFVPDAYEAFNKAASGDLSLADGVKFGGTTLDLGGTLLGTFSKSLEGAALSTALGKTAGVIGVAMDMGGAYENFQKGDVLAGSYDSVHAVVGAVGVAYPPVALCLGAWDAGVATGTWIANSPPVEAYEDNLVAYGAAHDSDIATRYDIGKRGVEALGNIVTDGWHGLFG